MPATQKPATPLSDQEILDETKTLFAAGFETTATALTWAIYLLAHNPEQASRFLC